MKMPIESPWRSFSPQKTGSFAPSTMSFEIGIAACEPLQRPTLTEEVRADPDRDPVEHDRRDHLVRSDGRLEDAGDPGLGRTGERADDEHERDVHATG